MNYREARIAFEPINKRLSRELPSNGDDIERIELNAEESKITRDLLEAQRVEFEHGIDKYMNPTFHSIPVKFDCDVSRVVPKSPAGDPPCPN